MNGSTANLRKAAIFIRSLDPDTAASVLARLSRDEAESVRKAIQSLGDWDEDEQDDVAAEFRRVGPIASEDPRRGVELNFSAAATAPPIASPKAEPRPVAKPFDFLEQARVESLVPYLSREHGQTVAVVLSYLPPKRAAEVLAALPPRLQADAVERMGAIGETDPSSLQVLERELAEWVKRQTATHAPNLRRTDTVAALLAAADPSVRNSILANVMQYNHELARQITPSSVPEPSAPPQPKPQVVAAASEIVSMPPQPTVATRPVAPPTAPRPNIQINDLARMDKTMLATVLRAVDAEVLVLALAGASDTLVDRIASQLPRPAAKAFRKRLSQIGPTRLRDVEAAQQEIVDVAAGIIQARRTSTYTQAAAPAASGR